MNDSQAVRQFSLEEVPPNHTMVLEMDPHEAGVPAGKTQFRILTQGPEPLLDLQYTELGKVNGPALRFIGSIPVRVALESNLEGIIPGKIVIGHQLVMEDPETKKKFIIPGKVANEEPNIFFETTTKQTCEK